MAEATIDMDLVEDGAHTQAQTIPAEGVSITFDTDPIEVPMQDVNRILATINAIGFGDKVEAKLTGTKAQIALKNVTEEELGLISRKVRISNWSSNAITVANKVTKFATDVADFTLNGALAPTTVAVADAALTTGRVIGTATIKAGAGIVSSAVHNGSAAVKEIWNSQEIKNCGTELKNVWSGISNVLFGKSGSSAWTKKSA